MRTRDCRFLVSLSEKEMSSLMKKVERSGLTRDAYVRSLIAGYEIKETPPVEFFEVLKRNLITLSIQNRIIISVCWFKAVCQQIFIS